VSTQCWLLGPSWDREQDSLRRNHRMFKPLAGLSRLADREEVIAQEAVREKY